MNILDENIPSHQRLILHNWRIRARQIGIDVGRRGMGDDEIIPLLLTLKRPTFFTRDKDFCHPSLRHSRYCLVYLDIERYEVASFVRRILKQPFFDTEAKRMGHVIWLSAGGISAWQVNHSNEISTDWISS